MSFVLALLQCSNWLIEERVNTDNVPRANIFKIQVEGPLSVSHLFHLKYESKYDLKII